MYNNCFVFLYWIYVCFILTCLMVNIFNFLRFYFSHCVFRVCQSSSCYKTVINVQETTLRSAVDWLTSLTWCTGQVSGFRDNASDTQTAIENIAECLVNSAGELQCMTIRGHPLTQPLRPPSRDQSARTLHMATRPTKWCIQNGDRMHNQTIM